ncbi:hypothetical protein FPV67DRAFT_1669219 [Lyophyllum atratum]|nr:hypothetical protein FPV67DRAFT_1669219 [Lyophyllum atratum]
MIVPFNSDLVQMTNSEFFPIQIASSIAPVDDRLVGAFLTVSMFSVGRYLGSKAKFLHGHDPYPHQPSSSPNVELTGGPGLISIKLGENAAVTNRTPEQQLHLLSQRLDPETSIKVVAELESGEWSEEEGFRALGKHLAILANEVSFGRWEDLTIRLPNVDLLYDSNRYRLPESDLGKLHHLNWTGHRQQLATSWLPFSPSILKSLTNLVITCEVSFDDCSRLLLYGEQVKNFELHSIQPNVDPVLYFLRKPLEFHPKDRKRRCLESLTLSSSQDVVPLLRLFKFPALRNIIFNLFCTTNFILLPNDFWTSLETVILRCDLSDEDSIWIQNQCGRDTKHQHIYTFNER